MKLHKFNTLVDLLTYFDSETKCREYLEMIRWQGELKCPYKNCGHDKVYKYSDGKRYKCAKCKRQYSVKVGTIFQNSKITLHKWFAAIYLITSHKKGISSVQLATDIGVTQKTAWYMNHRIRHALGIETDEKLSGEIEADETFIGGKERNKHRSKRIEGTQGRSTDTKVPVAGIVQRGGKVISKKVDDTSGKNLKPFVLSNTEKGSDLHTDEWFGYNGLEKLYTRHVIKHKSGHYVQGKAHTNTIESYWALLKRGIVGIYHVISAKHLQKYLDEFSFRYNTKDLSEHNRFNLMLTQVSTRLSYEDLINTNKNEKRWLDDSRGISKWVEAEQGSFSF